MTQRSIDPLVPTAGSLPRHVTRKRAPRLAAVIAGGVVLSLLAGGCGRANRTQQGGRPPVPVTVGSVEQKTVPVSFRAIGHIESAETVEVRARVGGELQRVFFEEGQTVRAGDRLFAIDPRPFRAALAQAEAQLARNQALLAKAEADITRYAGLVKQDYVTKEQYDQITADAAALRAAVAADQASIETAQLELDYCTISSPVTGRTGTINVDVGNLVKANDDLPMVTINQTRPIDASFPVPAQFLPLVIAHRADRIRVVATVPGDPTAAEGTLSFVDNAVDTSTGTVLLKATFPNQDERLWPGEFVDLTVILGEEVGRIVCPAAAVQTGQQGQYVFTVKEDRTVELRTVKVNRMDEHEAVIDEGLQAGETVVTDGQLRLVPGAAIEVKSPEAAGDAGR
ncbi:MAG: efflux RND transporter periplasmic adaptor subunit [Holophagae bacterium]|nr:MAG: efflux RND transporter periplasmic adaptor subunit [Holophagae bacterium]